MAVIFYKNETHLSTKKNSCFYEKEHDSITSVAWAQSGSAPSIGASRQQFFNEFEYSINSENKNVNKSNEISIDASRHHHNNINSSSSLNNQSSKIDNFNDKVQKINRDRSTPIDNSNDNSTTRKLLIVPNAASSSFNFQFTSNHNNNNNSSIASASTSRNNTSDRTVVPEISINNQTSSSKNQSFSVPANLSQLVTNDSDLTAEQHEKDFQQQSFSLPSDIEMRIEEESDHGLDDETEQDSDLDPNNLMPVEVNQLMTNSISEPINLTQTIRRVQSSNNDTVNDLISTTSNISAISTNSGINGPLVLDRIASSTSLFSHSSQNSSLLQATSSSAVQSGINNTNNINANANNDTLNLLDYDRSMHTPSPTNSENPNSRTKRSANNQIPTNSTTNDNNSKNLDSSSSKSSTTKTSLFKFNIPAPELDVSNINHADLIAIGTSKGYVQIWDTAEQKMLWNIKVHDQRVGAIAWNGDLVASGSRDRSVAQFDIKIGKRSVMKFAGHKQEVCGLKVWGGDRRFFSCSFYKLNLS